MGDAGVALAIRRAKRSGAKALDLSHRGIASWPPDVFELRQVEELDLTGNELTELPPTISRLEALKELNLSSNRIEALPQLAAGVLPHLRSLSLEGNPVAQSLPASTLRQLSQPDRIVGRTPSQIIVGLLTETPPAAAPAASFAAPAAEVLAPGWTAHVDPASGNEFYHNATTGETSWERPSAVNAAADTVTPVAGLLSTGLSDSDSDDPVRARGKQGGLLGQRDAMTRPLASVAERQSSTRATEPDRPERRSRQPESGRGGEGVSGRLGIATEVEGFRNRVKEPERQQQPDGYGGDAISSTAAPVKSSVPLWLQNSHSAGARHTDGTVSMASTLPSRRPAFDNDDETATLKNQLREEQRKTKRLEQDNKRLEDRLREQGMAGGAGGASSLPHFEFSEVDEGDVLSSSGGFSVIYRGSWFGTPVAIKKLFDPSNSAENLAEFDNEVQKLERLRHPNILQLLAVHRKPPALSIIMEMVHGGSFFQLLHNSQKFSFSSGVLTEVPVRQMVEIDEAIATGLAFVHARGIVHRDVKPHNVLLSPHLEVKICDFGLARMRSELMTGAMQFAGTPQYMAPEILRQQKYTDRVDVFAYGTLLWESMVRDIPFANLDTPEIRQKVYSGTMLPMSGSVPSQLQAIIRACWAVDQSTRPAMADVLLRIRGVLSDS